MATSRTLAERTRRPTGRPSNPVILLSGEYLTGKSFLSALLTASDRVGRSWYLQLGEVDGDPYGAIVDGQDRPVRYDLVEHDGTWADIITAVEQVKAEAIRGVEAGEAPPVFIFDSASQEWGMLSRWAENRAKKSPKNQKKLADDPNDDIDVGHLFWNAATRRHNRLMTLLLTFPGIVVITARGKWVSRMRNGQPVAGEKEYTIEAQKGLGFQTTAWVRLSHDEPPTIVGARMPRGGVRPGIDRALVVDGRRDERFRDVEFSLEWLIFDVLKYDPANASPRQLNEPVAGDEPDEADEAEAAGVSLRCLALRKTIASAATLNDLRAVWEDVTAAVKEQEITISEGADLRTAYAAQGAKLKGADTAPAAVPAARQPTPVGA